MYVQFQRVAVINITLPRDASKRATPRVSVVRFLLLNYYFYYTRWVLKRLQLDV